LVLTTAGSILAPIIAAVESDQEDLVTLEENLTSTSPEAIAETETSTAEIANGLQSTGRNVAESLSEQLAMQQVEANPQAGQILNNITMNDPRWPASAGWVKMQQIVQTSDGRIIIHYVYNTITHAVADYKFK
jgi:hypothetical protein